MSLKGKLSSLLLKSLPPGLKRHWVHRRAPAMTETLEGLSVKEAAEAQLCGRVLPGVELENGTQLVGEEARPRERLLFDWLAREKGLSLQHVRILLDVATRYLYPHMAVGYQSMRWPAEGRKHFHLQHTNYAAEDSALDSTVRAELAEVFKPQTGWAVIDIGSYFGHGAVWMAQEVGPTGRVLCVEAKELNVEVIREHIRRNELDQMEVRFNAIWKVAGETVHFHTTERQANAIDAEVIDGDTIPVVTTSLAALIDEIGVAPNLVSLTVNGAEVEAIEGLQTMEASSLPERIIAPGWYLKENEPRWKLIAPMLEELGYKVAVTSGGCVFGWLV